MISAINLISLSVLLPKKAKNDRIQSQNKNRKMKIKINIRDFLKDGVEGFVTIKNSKKLLLMIPGVFLTNFFL